MASLYDQTLQLRRVDPNRWMEFDGPVFMKLQESEGTWINVFSKVQLSPNAPAEVQMMFETARGAMVYSWFYYPLATLGMEHCYRTLELAVKIRVGKANSKRSYEKNLESLFDQNIIPAASRQSWDAARCLRNYACHPDGRHLTDPGAALQQLHTTAERIDDLFPRA